MMAMTVRGGDGGQVTRLRRRGKPVRGRERRRHRTVTVPLGRSSPSARQAAKSPGCLPATSGSPSFRALPGEACQGLALDPLLVLRLADKNNSEER